MTLKRVASYISIGVALHYFSLPADRADAKGDDAPIVKILVPKGSVGPRKSGMLCFPNGRFNSEDFFPSASFLRALIIQARADADSPVANFDAGAISLTDLKVNLCERDYLSGQQRYSGTLSANFEVISADRQSRIVTVRFTVDKKDAQSTAEIGQRIIEALFKQLSA